MFGLWLIIMFLVLPGAFGGAIGYIIGARDGAKPEMERRSTIIGAAVGAGAGLIVLAIVFAYNGL